MKRIMSYIASLAALSATALAFASCDMMLDDAVDGGPVYTTVGVGTGGWNVGFSSWWHHR
ncbi:MAG: hypothetical protein NC336_08235 [Clostridium sp.]|nr:hypothetical protein [Clostridium sp.]